MNLTQEDFQKAKRISRAIQEYLEDTKEDGLRSTDIYPILARKNLIEKDRHNGLHFRKFLKSLKENNLLKLIPQCKYQYSTNGADFLEWYFYRVKSEIKDEAASAPPDVARPILAPKMTDREITILIKEMHAEIENLPKRKDVDKFTSTQIETRKLYTRAYEYWSPQELSIMLNAYQRFGKIAKVAELLMRQPSAVKRKLEEHQ